MNCREFLAEFEERRQALSEWATLHLNECPDCRKTSGEQTRLWQMIDELRRIDAPNTFDYRVKARIADSKPSHSQPRFLPALRYVLPLCVVVLFLGLIAFNTNYFSSGDGAPQTVASAPQTPIEKNAAPLNSLPNNQIVAANSGDAATPTNVINPVDEPNDGIRAEQLTAANPSPKSPTKASKNNVKEEGGGSRDLAVTSPNKKFPQGLNPNQKIQPSPNGVNAKAATDEQKLEFFGIKINFEDGSRKVQTVEENSQAARAGVKAGDVIEAVDGEKLSAEPLRAKRFGFKRLTVLRGTERVEITLQK